jgi:hypothetical protein
MSTDDFTISDAVDRHKLLREVLQQQPRNTSRSSLRERLVRNVEAVCGLIVGHTAYVDTVEVLLPRPLSESAYQAIQQTCFGRNRTWYSRARRWGIKLQQPSMETVQCVTRLSPDHIVCRFDVALDLHTLSQADAFEVQQRLESIITQPWRGEREAKIYEATTYYGQARTRRNIVIYADVPSKMHSTFAAHIEFRYLRAKACQQRGVRQLEDLLNFDPTICLSRDARLSLIHWKSAERLIAQEARALEFRSRQARTRARFQLGRQVIERRIERIICAYASRDDSLPEWAERFGFPTQACLDAARCLRNATVHPPAHALIKAPLCLIWP